MWGECPGRGWCWRESKESNKRPCCPKYIQKCLITGCFPHYFAYRLPKALFFAQKYLTRYTLETFFVEYINLKKISLIKPLWSYTCSKFRKSYTPPAARIRVKGDLEIDVTFEF
jgi:hypothetical protein